MRKFFLQDTDEHDEDEYEYVQFVFLKAYCKNATTAAAAAAVIAKNARAQVAR